MAAPPGYVDRETITLTRDGVWLSDGTEIDHEQTRRAFARSLRRDAEGGYAIHVGPDSKRIVVEDTAYFVRRIDRLPDGGFELLINDETQERLDPSTLSYRPGRLTCRIKGGTEEAKFLHAAYFELLRDLHEDARCFYLVIGNRRVELSSK